jgi:hypothetical protein
LVSLSNLSYRDFLRSLNQPADASHVLDHFNGRSTTHQQFISPSTGFATLDAGLVHQDDDIDSTAKQEEARWSLFCDYQPAVTAHLREQEDGFGYLRSLGFSEWEAAELCRSAAVQENDQRVRWPGGFPYAS